MTEEEVVGPMVAKTIADLSRRPSREQYEIVVQGRDALKRINQQQRRRIEELLNDPGA